MWDLRPFVWIVLTIPLSIAALCFITACIAGVIFRLTKTRINSRLSKIVDVMSKVLVTSMFVFAGLWAIILISFIGQFIWNFITI